MLAFLLVLAAIAGFAQSNTAEDLIQAGHWKRARATVELRLREAPDDANALFLLSQIRNAFGDYTSPLQLAEKAIRLDGRVARYHRQLAEVQGVMAQHAGIFQQLMLARRFRKEIDTALNLDPRDVQALRDLLEFYLLAPSLAGGDEKKAEAMAQRIVAIDVPEGLLAQARIAGFQKHYARQEALLRQAAAFPPPSYKANLALAQFCLGPEHRNEASAETAATAAIAIDKGRIGGYGVLATIYAGRRDWVKLESLLTSAAREVPDDLAPYYLAADRLLADNVEPARTQRYLQVYLSQEAEGNQPSAADAHRKLSRYLQGSRLLQ